MHRPCHLLNRINAFKESVLTRLPSRLTPQPMVSPTCLDIWRGRGQLSDDKLHQRHPRQAQASGRNNFEEHGAHGPALRVAEEVDDDRVGPHEVGFEGFGNRGPEEAEGGGNGSDIESSGGDDAAVEVGLTGHRADGRRDEGGSTAIEGGQHSFVDRYLHAW